MSIIKRLRSETGSALFITILILSSLLVVGLSAASIAFSSAVISGVQQRSTVALYAAEAGAERSLWEARKNNWATSTASVSNIFGTTTLGNAAYYNTDYSSSSPNLYFVSQGTFRDTVRAVELSMDGSASSTPPPPPPPPGNWYSGSCVGIEVYEKDSPGQLAWKNVGTSCDIPQCSQNGSQDNDSLTSSNAVDFTGYLARDYCKSVGGRLPTKAEMSCIASNKTDYGDYGPLENDYANGDFHFANYYWTAMEANSTGFPIDTTDAYAVDIGTAAPSLAAKTIDYYVRCVK